MTVSRRYRTVEPAYHRRRGRPEEHEERRRGQHAPDSQQHREGQGESTDHPHLPDNQIALRPAAPAFGRLPLE